MYGRLISHDLVKRDAERILVERLREWVSRQMFSTYETDPDLEYRRAWNAAMKSVIRHLASR